MIQLHCPACGAEIQFKSSISIFMVCSYCKSIVVKHDMNLESLGKMAEIPPDMSPLQMGTRGFYRGKEFALVGRLKIGWDGGSWNEWYILFHDGQAGWLGEAQGFYSISFEQTDTTNVPPLQNLYPGFSWPLLKNEVFHIDDMKEAVCVGSQGELPLKAHKGRKSTSVDASGPKQQFATLDYGEDGIRFYLGQYVDFDKLHFTSLREIDGW